MKPRPPALLILLFMAAGPARASDNGSVSAVPEDVKAGPQPGVIGLWSTQDWQVLAREATPVVHGLNTSGVSLDFRPASGLMVAGNRAMGAFDPSVPFNSLNRRRAISSTGVFPPPGPFKAGDYGHFTARAPRTIGSATLRLGDLMVYNGSEWIHRPAPGSGEFIREGDWWTVSAGGTYEGIGLEAGDRLVHVGFQSASGTGFLRWRKGSPESGEFFRRGGFDPAAGLPSSARDGDLWEALAPGQAGGLTFAAGDTLMRTGGAWGVAPSGPVRTFAAGSVIHLACVRAASEWEFRRTDRSPAPASLTLNIRREPPALSGGPKAPGGFGIVVAGDSMARQPGTALAAMLPGRTVSVRSYGGGTARNVLSMMEYLAVNSDEDRGRTMVTIIGQNNLPEPGQTMWCRSRLMEMAAPADRRVLHVSMLGVRGLTWDGNRLVCANFEEQRVPGSANPYAWDVAALRSTWPDQWMWAAESLCGAAAMDNEPSIQWPGMSNREVAAAYGIPPLKYCRGINLTGVVPGLLKYRGTWSGAKLPEGGDEQDYYLRTGGGTVGNPIIKLPGGWREITYDPVHLGAEGDAIQAAGIAAILRAKGW